VKTGLEAPYKWLKLMVWSKKAKYLQNTNFLVTKERHFHYFGKACSIVEITKKMHCIESWEGW